MTRVAGIIILTCALAGCGPKAEVRATGEKPAEPVAAGPARSVSPDGGPSLQSAASVTEVVRIEGADSKLFATAAGDPAANGLYVNIAAFHSAAEGWRVYRIGDFARWRVRSQTPQRVVLDVVRERVDPASGAIVAGEETLIVSVPDGDGGPIAVTPAK